MSTGGAVSFVKTPETKNKNEIVTPPEAPVKVRVKFPQREREQQKRDREEEEERQASPSLDLPKKRVWVPPLVQLPPIELVEEDEEKQESPPTGLDFTRDAVLIKCCERVGARRGWEYGRIMQAAYDLLLVLWCKKQVGNNREFEFSCPEDIDECWHEFVLNTVHYAHFSRNLGFFPNHTSFTSDDPDEVKMGRIQALMTFGRSRGIKFNSEFWPRIWVPTTAVPNDDLGLFDVYVQTLTGKTMTVSVLDITSVLGLKQKLESLHGFPTDAQRLIYAGHNMDDMKLLTSYGIGPYSKVHLVLRNGNRNDDDDFQVFVKTTTGKIFPIRVMSTTTVSELKQKIKDKEGFPVDQQRVIHRGTEMNDNNTLDKYNVSIDAMIHLVIRLRGC
jgi:ubiquitin C